MEVVALRETAGVVELAIPNSQPARDRSGSSEKPWLRVRDVHVILRGPAFRQVGADEPSQRRVEGQTLGEAGPAMVLVRIDEAVLDRELGPTVEVAAEHVRLNGHDEIPTEPISPTATHRAGLPQFAAVPVFVLRQEGAHLQVRGWIRNGPASDDGNSGALSERPSQDGNQPAILSD